MLPPSGTLCTRPPPVMRRLIRSAGLSDATAEVLRRFAGTVEHYPNATILSAAGSAPRLKWILDGWTCELRVLPNGRRQIFSFEIPGDPVLARPLNAVRPCTVMTLTNVECLDVAQLLESAGKAERREIRGVVDHALSLAEERRYEKIVCLSRNSALQRVAELLLEFHDRLSRVGLVDDRGFNLPLTQKHLADALGLSLVHVIRSLKTLRLAGMATFRFGRVSAIDRDGLAALCGR
jgi:CRP-like cAMP-binding protein